MFVVEDETHAEHQGRFATFDEALAELRRRAEIPWDQAPNAAPCTGWRSCGRDYAIVEFDDAQSPWKEVRRVQALSVSALGVAWSVAGEESR
jgi:hypothetical protein